MANPVFTIKEECGRELLRITSDRYVITDGDLTVEEVMGYLQDFLTEKDKPQGGLEKFLKNFRPTTLPPIKVPPKPKR